MRKLLQSETVAAGLLKVSQARPRPRPRRADNIQRREVPCQYSVLNSPLPNIFARSSNSKQDARTPHAEAPSLLRAAAAVAPPARPARRPWRRAARAPARTACALRRGADARGGRD